MGAAVPAVTVGCSATPNILIADTATSSDSFGNVAQYMVGNSPWTNTTGASLVICRLDFKLAFNVGDISTNTYSARIYHVTGNSTAGLAGQSNTLVGTNSWSATWVAFHFATVVTLTNNATVGFFVGPAAQNAESSTLMYYKSDTTNTWSRTEGVTVSVLSADTGVATKIYLQQ